MNESGVWNLRKDQDPLLIGAFFNSNVFFLSLTADLLPTEVPSGDPSSYALPVFLLEPEDSLAARGVPAQLKCKVAHAIEARFVCNDETASEVKQQEMVAPESGTNFTELSVTIKRTDVMDMLGTFTCKCVAKSKKGEVESKEAMVKVACK